MSTAIHLDQTPQVEKFKDKTDFKFIMPTKLPKDWILEIKEPTEESKESEKIQLVRLNYLDKTDTYLMVSIAETKSNGKLDDFGENLKIKGINAIFQKLLPTEKYKEVTGGTLMWIQGDTLISLFSSRLSKAELVQIAESMISEQ